MARLTVIIEDKKFSFDAENGRLLVDALTENGVPVSAACGRKGSCRKCSVELLSGSFENENADEHGMVRSCRAVISGDAVIRLPLENGSGLTSSSFENRTVRGKSGIAVDIGTTTVAAAFVSPDGNISYASSLNPQSAYGADVISRIESGSGGTLDVQTGLIRDCVRSLISELSAQNAEELIVSGNTTMLHIFCGISPESIGVYPFEPAFTDARYYDGEELGINVSKITVLPCVSAFIGSDVVCGIYALRLYEKNETSLFCDLGTNGETVLTDGGRLFCTSTAAGPALEGACIECGVGGIDGAIDKVTFAGGTYVVSTVGDKKPVGICGAGLVDAVAAFRMRELIDENGTLDDERIYITPEQYISQKDIRQYQLAKSAVRSGIETLAAEAGVSGDKISKFYIAGGLGYYLNAANAISTGLLPEYRNAGYIASGNTSLAGAIECIGDRSAVDKMREIAKSCTVIDLGGNAEFSRRFTENMFF